MTALGDLAKQAGMPWCDPDDCPPAILRFDQEPIGTPPPVPDLEEG
jgi:hypothetical protein